MNSVKHTQGILEILVSILTDLHKYLGFIGVSRYFYCLMRHEKNAYVSISKIKNEKG